MVQHSHNARDTTGASPTVGELLSRVTENISALVRDEIKLLQAQAAEKGKAMGLGIGFFVGAAVLGLFAFGWLLMAGMFALALVLPYWAAALIVFGVLAVIAAVLGLIGKNALSKAPTPQAGENFKKDVEAVKQGVKS